MRPRVTLRYSTWEREVEPIGVYRAGEYVAVFCDTLRGWDQWEGFCWLPDWVRDAYVEEMGARCEADPAANDPSVNLWVGPMNWTSLPFDLPKGKRVAVGPDAPKDVPEWEPKPIEQIVGAVSDDGDVP